MTTELATGQPLPMFDGPPVVGHVFPYLSHPIGIYERLSRTCGDIGAFKAGPRTMVFVNSSELLEDVLVKNAASYEKVTYSRQLMDPVLGNGILLSENQVHKRQRRLMAPAFQFKRIAGYATPMVAYAHESAAGWSDGQTIDVAHEMMRLTMRIVGKTLFDVDLEHEAAGLGEAMTVAQEVVGGKMRLPLPIPHSWPLPGNIRLKKALARLDGAIYGIIAERRAANEDRGDLISILLRAQDEDGGFMTDQQLRDESMTLFLAGHETTANALTWTWYLLSQHPDVYARLREEVDTALAGRSVTYADLERLPYALQVFKESLRLYPPIYVFGRENPRSMVLGGYAIPAGSMIVISPYTMHRRPDYFPDPERFDPDRFSPENEAKLPRFAYLPFSGGPRICLGNFFATMEGHLLLATLVQHVTFDLAVPVPVAYEELLTLRPTGGMPMRVRVRM